MPENERKRGRRGSWEDVVVVAPARGSDSPSYDRTIWLDDGHSTLKQLKVCYFHPLPTPFPSQFHPPHSLSLPISPSPLPFPPNFTLPIPHSPSPALARTDHSRSLPFLPPHISCVLLFSCSHALVFACPSPVRMPSHLISRHAIPCHIMPYYAIPCHITSCPLI